MLLLVMNITINESSVCASQRRVKVVNVLRRKSL